MFGACGHVLNLLNWKFIKGTSTFFKMPCSHNCPSPKPVIYEMISLRCLVQFSNATHGLLGDLRLGWGSLRLCTSNTEGTGSIHGLGTKIPFAWQCGQKIQKRKKKRQPQRPRAAKNKINTAVKKKKGLGSCRKKGWNPHHLFAPLSFFVYYWVSQ